MWERIGTDALRGLPPTPMASMRELLGELSNDLAMTRHLATEVNALRERDADWSELADKLIALDAGLERARAAIARAQ